MSKTTTLGESQLTQSPNETITVELVQPDDMPPIVKIGWPLPPTVIDPERDATHYLVVRGTAEDDPNLHRPWFSAAGG